MNKKYLVILVVVAAIAAGLYVHVQKKKEAKQAVHHAKQYERMLAMAQKSPMAGLTQMGAAINKYKVEHQAFPPKLMDLYPQYIPSKEFISDIQWVYTPSSGDFYLSKSMVMGGKTLLASVSSTLMPQMESAIMVAAKGGTNGSRGQGKAAQQVKMQSHEDFVASLSANQALAKKQEAAYRARYRQKKAPVIPLVTETVSFESADEVDIERASVLQGRFYCWKNEDGSYGYSNIQYPERRKVEKFNGGRWMVVQTEFNQRPQSPADETVADGEAQALAALDRHKGQNLIVWRDPKGLIGYGNVQYPQTDELEQYNEGQWTALASPKADLSDSLEDELIEPADITIAEIGAQNSDDFMVWQDEAGHVGFSNVQYPEQKPLRHYQEGQWVAVKPAQWDTPVDSIPGDTPDAVDTDAVTAASSQNYIVWRDADGHLGISNVQLPTSTDQLEVHLDGEWLAAAR
jgi:hypothetical protein